MNTHGSKWIRPVKRLAVYLRDGFRCAYCGRDLHDSPPADVTLDHLLPRCFGGSNDAENLVTACRSCNSQRADRKWREYATGGAVARIAKQRRRVLPLALAQAIVDGDTALVDAVEARR